MPTANKVFQMTSRADQFWGKYDQPKFEKCPSRIYIKTSELDQHHAQWTSCICICCPSSVVLLVIAWLYTMYTFNSQQESTIRYYKCLSCYNGPCLHTPLLVTFKRTLNTVPTFVISRANDDSRVYLYSLVEVSPL